MSSSSSTTSGTSTNSSTGRHASMSDIKSDVATLKHDLTDMARGVAADGKAALEQSYEKTAEQATELLHKGKEEIEKAHDSVAEYVSKRPVTSLAIAFGAGAILARLMRKG